MTKQDIQQILQDEASRWSIVFSKSDMLSNLYWAISGKGLKVSLINDRYLLVEDFEFNLRKKDGRWVIRSY